MSSQAIICYDMVREIEDVISISHVTGLELRNELPDDSSQLNFSLINTRWGIVGCSASWVYWGRGGR